MEAACPRGVEALEFAKGPSTQYLGTWDLGNSD